jgi:hypothetical protein
MKTERLDNYDYEIDETMAREIRILRALHRNNGGGRRVAMTWRAISALMIERYPGRFPAELSGFYPFGEELGIAAARLLGENFNKPPWL